MSKVDKVLDNYSAKVFRNRKKHVIELDEDRQEIGANSRSIPGIINHRGCCYAGCKGVVLGPTKDVVVLTHGPIGCGYYSWLTRRNKAIADEGGKNFVPYCFSTDLGESDIVFGGETKLKQALKEIVEIFSPEAIFICSTCPVGLIGDDLPAIAKEATDEYGIDVISFPCEGYKGVSQSGGHHIANNIIIKTMIGKDSSYKPTKPSINILGEYNIGGDAWEMKRILTAIGYEVIAVISGDGSIKNYRKAQAADLNLIQCHRSMNYIAEMMKTQYGTAWMKCDFIGLNTTIETLRAIAKFFDIPEITERTEEVIKAELDEIKDDIAYYKSQLEGKTAALFVGGSRSHHYQMLLKDFGVETLLAGYEFAHRDDYEGRVVIPDIVEDADLKNIDTIQVQKDEAQYKIYRTEEEIEELKKEITLLENYEGMEADMNKGAIISDDLNHFETEKFIEELKPDMFFSGIKDKFVIQKGGILSRQLHSYDYSGPYAGFKGALNFGRDVAMGVTTPVWKYTKAPWQTEEVLEGSIGGGK